MPPPRYFTKSRYRIACECPVKLYYSSHPERYPSRLADDPFVQALQDGGFQVGALARLYHAGGALIEAEHNETALRETAERMQASEVTLFEAAFHTDGLHVRTDVLVKEGNRFILKEVKSKSFDPATDRFVGARGSILNGWDMTLRDVAFQTFVLRKVYPEADISTRLILCDKSAVAALDGLNQIFKVERRDGSRPYVRQTREIDPEILSNRVLTEQDVTDLVSGMIDQPTFISELDAMTGPFFRDENPAPTPSGKCRVCEFRIPDHKLGPGQRCGFRDCWAATGLDDETLRRPLVLDIGNLRANRKDELFGSGRYLMEQLDPATDLPDGTMGDRMRLQVEKETDPSSPVEWIDPELFTRMAGWTFPLHFIDFETAMVAIPFYAGQRPYQTIAFQFSCHTVAYNGSCFHSHEWIQTEPGRLPNIDFVRALKAALDRDGGTIFRYSSHENSVLNQIYSLLESHSDADVPDRRDLMTWIRSITTHKVGKETIPGERNMVDLCELVRKYYYHRGMRGSNSIKKVLPAILSTSSVLHERYSRPYYSTNFPGGHIWWHMNPETGEVDPYGSLPPMESSGDDEDEGETIKEGGAASMAFARMQFTDMSLTERDELRKSLLRYCELDTLAMAMIYQHWCGLRDRS